MLKNSQASADTEQFDNEQVKAAIELDHMMVQLEQEFRRDLDPKEIILKVLKLTCEYYGGDWCGVLDISQNVGVWAPYWWYSAKTGGMTQTNFYDFEIVSEYPTWTKALQEEQTLCIPEIDPVTVEEAHHYQRLHVQSVIAAPYYKGATGFVVVRNPTKFVQIPDLLKLSAYIASCEFREFRLIESCKHQAVAPCIEKEDDVCINLFGGLNIVTAHGVIKSESINRMQIASVIVYLALHRDRACAPSTIANTLFDDFEEADNFCNNIRHYIYRFRQEYGDIFSDKEFIITTASGYRLNPELNIKVDIESFDRLCLTVRHVTDPNEKIRVLEEIVKMYRQDVFPPAKDSHWLMSTIFHYSEKFMDVMKELLELLEKRQDYTEIHEQCAIALRHHPRNLHLYYWMIISMEEQQKYDLAMREFRMAIRYLCTPAIKDLSKLLGERYEPGRFVIAT